MAQDYLSLIDAVFNQFFKFMVQYVTEKCSGSTPAWTHIPQAVLTAIAAVYANWYTAYSKVLGPHTPVDTEAKNAAKKAAKKAVRAFVNQYLRFDPVTDEDRTAIGIIFILSNLLCHFDPVIRLTIFSLFLKNIDFPKY